MLSLLLTAISCGDNSTGPDVEPLKDRIVFHSDRDGDFEIFVMNADGSNPQPLTQNSARDQYPVVSNDGTRIAFTSDRNGADSIYVMHADGSGIRGVTDYESIGYYEWMPVISWSPDDKELVYTNRYNVRKVGIDGTGDAYLQGGQYPDWSPQTDRIVVSDDYEIKTMNYDGTGLKTITEIPDTSFVPRWSPDASKFAYVSEESGYHYIHTMNTDGTGDQRIFGEYADFTTLPRWSPDGTELVFQTDRDYNDEIYKISADGTGTAINLTANSANDGAPSWSPRQ